MIGRSDKRLSGISGLAARHDDDDGDDDDLYYYRIWLSLSHSVGLFVGLFYSISILSKSFNTELNYFHKSFKQFSLEVKFCSHKGQNSSISNASV